mmetsp:Transcript_64578/g.114883  ORF Transcript_64578/g.114883 Transcript_64578/m.114883 type:complete len:102 (+) Transcript_64578:21-326(+)
MPESTCLEPKIGTSADASLSRMACNAAFIVNATSQSPQREHPQREHQNPRERLMLELRNEVKRLKGRARRRTPPASLEGGFFLSSEDRRGFFLSEEARRDG